MQIVADVVVDVGFFLGATADTMLDTTLSEEDTRCNDHLEFDTDWRLVSARSDDHVS